MVLIGSAQSLQFDATREAAILQFPEHRPTPFAVQLKEFDNGARQPDNGKGAQTNPYPDKGSYGKDGEGQRNHFAPAKGKGKDTKGGKSSCARTAYMAEIPENPAEDPPEQPDEDDPEIPPDADEPPNEDDDEEPLYT